MHPDISARNRLEQMLLDESAEPTDLPLSLLTAITNNFSVDQEIGSGGYAVVYKGVLRNGTVAVKKLHDMPMDETFSGEVGCLMRVKHKNIVRLFGYCAETQNKMVDYKGNYIMAEVRQRLLCFEYVPGGTLHNYITDVPRGLEWRVRHQIIRGICEGLSYLHETRIVHLDLKPGNILLDYNMVPKILGFDLSRFFHENQSQDLTKNIAGSLAYLAPEYINTGLITFKSDIYALGVIISEILTGEKIHSSVVNVLEGWRNRLGTSGEDRQLEQIRVCAEICIRCLDNNPNKRPAIQRIMKALNETESMAPDTQRIIEMLNDEESMDEFIEDGMGTLLQAQEPYSEVQQGTLEISGVESSEIELNILELIVAGSEEPGHIDFILLQSVTENFSEKKKVGVGGCGEVYKGILQNGVVAVKRLFKTRTIKDKIFHREVKSLITARHENIVRFLGYCSVTEERALTFGEGTIIFDIRERLLCFEYISNGSLDNYLTDELKGLEWHTRYEIIVGICKGLLYLHKKDIIHMDLKPANILLDDRMVPKITDFGLSRLDDNNSQTTTTSRLISPGYCAPEYSLEGKSSKKSDMYSFGVLINELVTGTKKMPNITKILRKWKHRWITSSKHTALGYQQVTKCLELAQRCMQIDPNGRPDISDIIDELNEIDSKDDQFRVIPCLEDMLGIEPLEIQFPFDHDDQQILHPVELINDTDDYFAFITKTSPRRLRTEPDKGIVPPRSKCNFTVTMMQQVMALPSNRYKEKITVLSTRADGGLAAVDLTRDMFIENEGNVVDEVDITVVFGTPPSVEES